MSECFVDGRETEDAVGPLSLAMRMVDGDRDVEPLCGVGATADAEESRGEDTGVEGGAGLFPAVDHPQHACREVCREACREATKQIPALEMNPNT